MGVTHRLEQALATMSILNLGFIALAAAAGFFVVQKIQYARRKQRFVKEFGCKPVAAHVPLKDPIFGLDDIIRKISLVRKNKILQTITNDFQILGNTFVNYVFGQTVVITNEPENVKAILSLKFKDFGVGIRIDTLGRLLGSGIFTIDGDGWHNSRQLIRPNFIREQVADLESFERHIQMLFRLLPRDGSTVDLQEYFFKFTIDSATEFLFGKSTNTLKAQLSGGTEAQGEAMFATAFNTAQDYVSQLTRIGALRRVYFDKAGEEAIRVCHTFVDQYVSEAVEQRERMDDLEKRGIPHDNEKYMFLRELARSTKDKKRLRDELLNVLLAGRDTTASLLANMWLVIARRPDIFAKLRQEAQETLEGRLPTYKELKTMKYLKYCMNESLRLYPVVPSNGRVALRDTFIPRGGGPDGKSPVFIAKGEAVAYLTYAMHRRKDYFGDDAEEFKPERWETLRPGWEYLPFNGGPRICLGQQYALTEAGYVTVRLLQEFAKVDSRDSRPWTESLTLTLCSKNGTRVALTPA